MNISFVIPAYNEEQYLGKTLEQLIESAEAIGEPYEIIVVADGCTDGTADVARQHGTRLLEVDLRHIAAVRAITDGAAGGGAHPVLEPPIPWWAVVPLRLLVCLYFRSLRFVLGGYLFAARSVFEAMGGFDEQYFAAEDAAFCRTIRRHGRFVVLREPMITSGRKIEEISTWEGISTSMRLVLRGRKALRQREGLGVWYEQRTPRG